MYVYMSPVKVIPWISLPALVWTECPDTWERIQGNMLDGLEEDMEWVHLWDAFLWPQYGNC